MLNCVVKKLSKSYTSGFKLGPIDLSIEPGSIIGLLGQNGAGKTTLIRLLLGALRPDTGSVRLLGVDVKDQPLARSWIGYLDEEPIHYDWMKIQWFARFYSSYYSNWDNDLFLKYLGIFSLDLNMRLGQLSKGSKVRLGFALCLAHYPRLLLLDEPTSGLDPLVRIEILDAIGAYVRRRPEASVLFSSHITSDLERVCNRAIVLEKGTIVSDSLVPPAGPPRDLTTLEEKFLHSLTTDTIQ